MLAKQRCLGQSAKKHLRMLCMQINIGIFFKTANNLIFYFAR